MVAQQHSDFSSSWQHSGFSSLGPTWKHYITVFPSVSFYHSVFPPEPTTKTKQHSGLFLSHLNKHYNIVVCSCARLADTRAQWSLSLSLCLTKKAPQHSGFILYQFGRHQNTVVSLWAYVKKYLTLNTEVSHCANLKDDIAVVSLGAFLKKTLNTVTRWSLPVLT
jgi:hypothetical protein